MSWWMVPVWVVFSVVLMFASFFLGGFVYGIIEGFVKWWTKDETKYIIVTRLDERGVKP
jgi:ABC-type transport system involved in cytochrome c biogenesis permease subunit